MENPTPVTPGSPTVEAPKQEGVENKIAAPDYAEELKAKDELISKLLTERDNYKKMGLKYKKEAEIPEETATEDDRLRQIAREELMNSDIARASAEKEELIKKMAKENSELRTAIANKAQVSSMPGGGSQPQDTVTVETVTAEQKAQLTRQAQELGIDPATFIASFVKNWEKNRQK